jgi:hypothetical protein
MENAPRWFKGSARTRARAARKAGLAPRPRAPAVFLAFACVFATGCVASAACADPRFGDSTWVAPAFTSAGDSSYEGPRVALADHERGWETALRAPFRVVFYPLRLVANGFEAAVGFAGPRYFEPKPNRPARPGPSIKPAISIGSINDIGVGPSLEWAGFPAAGARLHLAGTWSRFDRRTAHLVEAFGERRPVSLRLSADYEHRSDRRFYGIGNETPETARSYFLLETSEVEAALLLGSSRLRRLQIVGGYSSMTPRRGAHGTPLLEDVYSPADAPYARRNTQVFIAGIRADLASLDDAVDPSRGVHGRIDLRHAAGLRPGDPDYDQWRLECRAYLPVFAKRRVLAVRGVYAGIDPRGGANDVLPFYRLAMSDGATRFAGYDSERFRDRQLVLARIEYRWIVLSRLSATAIAETGEVAPRWRTFDRNGLHSSYGGGLRMGATAASALRFEVANSSEGVHAVISLGGDF